ncbi:MAG: hypothetical protein ACXWC3_07335, partial [Burkholderiales bacterium]
AVMAIAASAVAILANLIVKNPIMMSSCGLPAGCTLMPLFKRNTLLGRAVQQILTVRIDKMAHVS